MIISELISKLRRKYNDSPEKHQDTIQGDGASTVFRMQFFPILEGSFKLYKDNDLQDSSTYTIDLDTGDLVVSTAPTVDEELKAQYQ